MNLFFSEKMGKNILKRIKDDENFMINFYKHGIKINATHILEDHAYGLLLDVSGEEIFAVYIGEHFEYIHIIDLIYEKSSDEDYIFLS